MGSAEDRATLREQERQHKASEVSEMLIPGYGIWTVSGVKELLDKRELQRQEQELASRERRREWREREEARPDARIAGSRDKTKPEDENPPSPPSPRERTAERYGKGGYQSLIEALKGIRDFKWEGLAPPVDSPTSDAMRAVASYALEQIDPRLSVNEIRPIDGSKS